MTGQIYAFLSVIPNFLTKKCILAPLNVSVVPKTIILAVGNDQVIDELYAE